VAAIDSHFIQSMEASMFYPQGNSILKETSGYPQGGFGYPQGDSVLLKEGSASQRSASKHSASKVFRRPPTPSLSRTPCTVPAADAQLLRAKLRPITAASVEWATSRATQAALQLQALLQLLAPQLAAQSLTLQHRRVWEELKKESMPQQTGSASPLEDGNAASLIPSRSIRRCCNSRNNSFSSRINSSSDSRNIITW